MWAGRVEQSRGRHGSWVRLKKLKYATMCRCHIVQKRICIMPDPVVVHVSYNAMPCLPQMLYWLRPLTSIGTIKGKFSLFIPTLCTKPCHPAASQRTLWPRVCRDLL
jgi:hypothetical protein